ncbi:MAG: hypothetical protein ACOZBL_01570 [Patescibacteria group bacterium]
MLKMSEDLCHSRESGNLKKYIFFIVAKAATGSPQYCGAKRSRQMQTRKVMGREIMYVP